MPRPLPNPDGRAVIVLPACGDYGRALAMRDPTTPTVYVLDSTMAILVPMGLPTPMRRVQTWNGWTALLGPGVPYRPGPWEDRSADE